MRGLKALILFSVVLALVCVATAGFAATGGERGRPEQPGKSKASPHAAKDPSNPDGTYRGKSGSTPDQDGIGADHGIVNNDKTGPGTDGNNGCGNDADGEDDNNGWCGHKPSSATPAPSVSPSASVGTEVLGRSLTRTEVLGRELTRTGAPVAAVVVLALMLIAIGVSLRTIASEGR